MVNYKLQKPIKSMSDVEITELNLDYDALTLGDFKTANKIASMISESQPGAVNNSDVSPRLNSDLRIGVAWAAALKGTKGISIHDVLQLSLVDAMCLSEDALSSYLFR